MARRMIVAVLALTVLVGGWLAPAEAGHHSRQRRPDLIVSSIAGPPADGTAVTSFATTVSTENTGRAAARRSVTRVFLSLDESFSASDIAVGDVRVPRLRKESAPYDTTIEVTVPTSVEPVAYSLLACADATDRVKELQEANNCTASAGTISFGSPPPPPPPPGDASAAQDVIAADLEAGLITYPTSLQHRTWALFGDLRLPDRYRELPSQGDDQSLFTELDALFAELPAEVQAAVEPYVVPPTDPRSAFGPAPALAPVAALPSTDAPNTDSAVLSAAAEEPSDTKCRAPATWRHTDWTPAGGSADDGFRVWVCAASDAEQNLMTGPVVDAASALWAPMTEAAPDGMGKPVPDTVNGNTENFGNGKIDILILYTSDCDNRTCPLFPSEDPSASFRLGAARTIRGTCGAPGYPSRSCSDDLAINAGLVCPAGAACSTARLKGTLAHEIFHVLQDAHNEEAGSREVQRRGDEVVWEKSWYVEASAVWASWYYAGDPDAYAYFTNAFQLNNRSLLKPGNNHEYGSWVYPLLMQRDAGASAVFASWRNAESATDPEELDDAVDGTFLFADHFRDMSVANVNPEEYFADGGVGLEADIWQTPFT
ncbi:MAG: CARDB domain-containing protein, partial [Acidimicrobiia bacterium]